MIDQCHTRLLFQFWNKYQQKCVTILDNYLLYFIMTNDTHQQNELLMLRMNKFLMYLLQTFF
jgi:hypothetical protein